MKTLFITSAVEYDGKHQPEGTTLKGVPNGIAAQLVIADRAVYLADNTNPIELQSPDPTIEHRDPDVQPVKRGRKPKQN